MKARTCYTEITTGGDRKVPSLDALDQLEELVTLTGATRTVRRLVQTAKRQHLATKATLEKAQANQQYLLSLCKLAHSEVVRQRDNVKAALRAALDNHRHNCISTEELIDTIGLVAMRDESRTQ